MAKPVKPVGIRPVELDGIILRKSSIMPQGIQALYDERSGQILWLGLVGTTPDPERGIRATAITMSHEDYEKTIRDHHNEQMRKQRMLFKF